MKYFALSLAAGLALCLANPADAAGKKIRKAADFNAQVVGKSLVYGDGTKISIGNGTLKGKTGKGDKIIGAWNWQGKFFCRNIQIGSNKLPTDCQAVVIDGDQISFIRKKGKGDSSTATLK